MTLHAFSTLRTCIDDNAVCDSNVLIAQSHVMCAVYECIAPLVSVLTITQRRIIPHLRPQCVRLRAVDATAMACLIPMGLAERAAIGTVLPLLGATLTRSVVS